MSLELMFKPKKIEQKPYLMFIYGVLFSTLAILLSYKMFPRYASLILVTFTLIPLVPLMVKLIEDDELVYEKRKGLFRHHYTFKAYSWLFIGVVVSISIWYFFLPPSVSQSLFSEQITTLYELEGPLATYSDEFLTQGCDIERVSALLPKGETTRTFLCRSTDLDNDNLDEAVVYLGDDTRASYVITKDEIHPYSTFMRNFIMKNNLMISGFIFLTSFIFGAGALFVIIWNATIIGVFIGDVAREAISETTFVGKLSAYFTGLNLSVGKIILHGVPEFFGFFTSAIAGGVLSVAFIRHGIFDERTQEVCKDALILFGLSVVMIVGAAFIEVL